MSSPRETSVAVLTEVPHSRADELICSSCDAANLKYELLHVLEEAPLQDSGRTRCPSPDEINARSNELEEMLSRSLATHVVLAGNVPLQAFRQDLRIGRMRKRPFVMRGRIMFPIINPAAALRVPAWAREIESDLYHLEEIIKADDWTLKAPNTCVWCQTRPTEPQWDSNGVLYCQSHWRTR